MGNVAVTRRIIERKFTIPRNTPSTAPATQALNIVDTQLVSVNVIIPAGHMGLTGLAVRLGTTRVVPWDDPNAWLRGNNEDKTFPVYTQGPAIATLLGFNTGVLEHSFYLRFLVDDDAYLTPSKAFTTSPL